MKKKTPKWKCARKCQATRKITNRCDCQHTGSPPISPLRFPFLFYFFWWPWHESSRQKNVIQVPLLYVNQETVDFILKKILWKLAQNSQFQINLKNKREIFNFLTKGKMLITRSSRLETRGHTGWRNEADFSSDNATRKRRWPPDRHSSSDGCVACTKKK